MKAFCVVLLISMYIALIVYGLQESKDENQDDEREHNFERAHGL